MGDGLFQKGYCSMGINHTMPLEAKRITVILDRRVVNSRIDVGAHPIRNIYFVAVSEPRCQQVLHTKYDKQIIAETNA